jgi:hypothetical protein
MRGDYRHYYHRMELNLFMESLISLRAPIVTMNRI